MKRLSQFLCLSFLVLTFSCDPDSTFDDDNPDAKIVGQWEVKSVESISYNSTITSPTGESDTSEGSFIGSDINLDLNFADDNTFTSTGTYNQILTVQGNFPEPFVIESRYDDFEGGGTWDISNNVLKIKTSEDADFQNANLNVFTDTEMEFDYQYTRTIIEGTVVREIDTEVTFVLEKR